jgi:hypothetical protein
MNKPFSQKIMTVLPYAYKIASQVSRLDKSSSPTIVFSLGMDIGFKELIEPMANQIATLRTVEKTSEVHRELQQQISAKLFRFLTEGVLCNQIAMHQFYGRRNFKIEQALAAQLLQTDLGDLTLEDMHFPLSGFFFQFDEGDPEQNFTLQQSSPSGQLESGRIEGAFVSYFPKLANGKRHLRISFVAKEKGRRVPSLTLNLREDETFGVPIKRLVDAAIAYDLEDMHRNKDRNELTKRVWLTMPLLEQHYATNRDEIEKALLLVLNTLAYMGIAPTDQTTVYPDDAPKSLVNLAENGSRADRSRAINKMEERGFLPVVSIGKHYIKQNPQAPNHGTKTHWRRGHWRNQPYGERLSLRKIIWIQPTLISLGSLD